MSYTSGSSGGNGGQRELAGRDAARSKVEALANRRQHAQAEAIDFENAQRVEVVLVPLDDGAVGHRGVFDRRPARTAARASSPCRRRAATDAAESRPAPSPDGPAAGPRDSPDRCRPRHSGGRELARATVHDSGDSPACSSPVDGVLVLVRLRRGTCVAVELAPFAVFGQRIDPIERQAERLADVADGAAWCDR